MMRLRLVLSVVCAALLAAAASPAAAISTEDEIRVGRRVMAEVRDLELTEDPALKEIGGRLAGQMARQELPWRFWVIENMEAYNAFAAPGGFVFITRKYLRKLSADEAAFVIGHEMAHIDLHHYERNVERRREATVGHMLLNLLIKGNVSGAWRTATDIGATAYMTHYSRALEKEADLAGYRCAEAAGYDARLAVTALSKLGEQPNLHPWIVNIYSTHPLMTSREDRLAALGGEEPEEVTLPEPSPDHQRDLTQGLEPLDPRVPLAVRILAPDGQRWENAWRKNFTKRLHLRLIPLGFTIAGDDIMYHRDLGDPLEAARSRDAEYLLLVTVHTMTSEARGPGDLTGTPTAASAELTARLLAVDDGSEVWSARVSGERERRDVLPVDQEILYPDTCLGSLVDDLAGQVAHGCATAAGAKPAQTEAAQEPGG
jgi:Zn-dependent protease with chaperone function